MIIAKDHYAKVVTVSFGVRFGLAYSSHGHLQVKVKQMRHQTTFEEVCYHVCMFINQNDLADIRKRHSNQKLVLTAGTFDLFHVGHLEFLENTKKYGDVVVLMLSGDNRVKARKGSKRPIIPEAERAKILDALKIIDYVFIDPSILGPKEIDPIHKTIIQNLDPDYYVTDGPDPRFIKLLDKSKFITLERDESRVQKSTTEIIKQIIKLYSN